jgi:hypothetical protein
MVKHWLEDPNRSRLPAHEHINRPRISAETILRLITWRNQMRGIKRSLFEESQLAAEQNQ